MLTLIKVIANLMLLGGFMLTIEQMMYQDKSIIYRLFTETPKFYLRFLSLQIGLIVISVGYAIYLNNFIIAGTFAGLLLNWVCFFWLYNYVIRMDVQNRILSPEPVATIAAIDPEDGLGDIPPRNGEKDGETFFLGGVHWIWNGICWTSHPGNTEVEYRPA
jgi:hypothetical protein